MEITLESRQGRIRNSDDRIFNFLSNFNNLGQFVPKDKVSDFHSSEDQCTFKVPSIGEVGLRIIERIPYKTIKITGDGSKQQFIFWIQLKRVEDDDTRIKLTLTADVNPMLKMMVSKPLQQFLDKLVDAFELMPRF